MLYLRIVGTLGRKQFIDDHAHASWRIGDGPMVKRCRHVGGVQSDQWLQSHHIARRRVINLQQTPVISK